MSEWEQVLRAAFVLPAPPTDDRFEVLLKRLEAAVGAIEEAPSPPQSPVVASSDGPSDRPPIASPEATPNPRDGLQPCQG